MATHHPHHHQCHCLPTPSTPTTTTCYCTTAHHPPPHPISSYHHHPQIHQYPPPQNHHTQPYNYYPQQTPPPLDPTVSSLIHRIAALESSLRRRKHSPPPSLRHAAARTIQTHFRAFLVRRSVTLRHLKQLASIKSALNRLKSSVSTKPHFDSRIVSRELMNLLIKLDSIQGFDPMIRDGKRSISRELVRFMELIDGMCVESEVIAVKNVGFGKNSKGSVILKPEREFRVSGSRVYLSNERKCVDGRLNGVGQLRVGALTKSQGKSQPKVKKNVRFDEDGNVCRVFESIHKQASSGGSDSSNGDDDEVVEVEEIGVSSKEPEVEEDESSEMSENEMDQRKNLSARIDRLTKKNQRDQEDNDDDDEEDDSFVFSAPLPAKMEY